MMNRSPISLSGVFPPIPTPFDAEGEVVLDALAENLARWNAHGLAGYVVVGSSGEAVYLSAREKQQVWETARQAIPSDKVMIAGTGCESTRETIALTRQAAQAGADAALVVTPNYYDGQMTPEGLVGHYQAVADGSPIPIVLYNVPKFTHVDMDAATIARAARHPNIVGIKDSGGNIAKLADVVRLTEDDFQVLAGSAGFFFAGLALGAVGGVLGLANVAPRQSVDIYRLFGEGRWDEAAGLQRRMLPVNAAVTARFGIAGLKAALDMLGYYGGPVRSPLVDLAERDRQALRDALVTGGLLEAG
jgi:4-hydroxy-2-oxoglutarate aldolase